MLNGYFLYCSFLYGLKWFVSLSKGFTEKQSKSFSTESIRQVDDNFRLLVKMKTPQHTTNKTPKLPVGRRN